MTRQTRNMCGCVERMKCVWFLNKVFQCKCVYSRFLLPFYSLSKLNPLSLKPLFPLVGVWWLARIVARDYPPFTVFLYPIFTRGAVNDLLEGSRIDNDPGSRIDNDPELSFSSYFTESLHIFKSTMFRFFLNIF